MNAPSTGEGAWPGTPSPSSDEGARRLLDAAREAAPGVGEQIGPYELVAEIGRGAASAVFRARQQQPVARDLAIKVLVDPSPSANVAARFRRERALLARLRHRGVVPLVDAGETPGTDAGPGVPWFAMPLVDGEPIDRWCERHGAPRAVRLRLLEDVARAVGAAHALGIVHRDLKPGNILVTGTLAAPEVLVIDFGIAKVLDDGLLDGVPGAAAATGDAVVTRVGAVVGTPEFMSPEQANLDGLRVGPPSDVYALGLVACLLLAGRAPGIERTSAESRPPIGARLRLAADRSVPPLSELAADHSLRGEVEWIVGSCCAYDPKDRYANAGALADDLARLREGRPIVAAPRDSGYEVSFALRKHRSSILLGAAALVVAVGSLGYGASREAARADAEHARNKELSKVLEQARMQLLPLTGRNRGDVVGDPVKAIEIAETMHSINRAVLGEQANETQQSALILARSYDRAGRYADAEPLFRALLAQALAMDTRMGDWAYLRMMLGGCLRRQGVARAAEAEGILREALAGHERHYPNSPSVGDTLIELAMVLNLREQFEESRSLYERAIAHHAKAVGESHIRTREAKAFLAEFEAQRGDRGKARELYRAALEGLWSRTVPGTPEASDANRLHADRWRDAWEGDLAWLDIDDALREGKAPDADDLAELRARSESLQARSPNNPRIARWQHTLEAAGVPAPVAASP